MPFIRYVAVSPETIVSVVKTGKYPSKPADYLMLQSDAFYVKTSAIDCVIGMNRTPHQIFVLKLALPENNNPPFLNPAWVQHIFVYSQRGYNLVSKLLGDSYQKSMTIRPDIYSSGSPATARTFPVTIPIQTLSSRPATQVVSPPKKRKVEELLLTALPVIFSESTAHALSIPQKPHVPIPAPAFTPKYRDKMASRDSEKNRCKVELIRGNSHWQLLEDLINSAQEEIIITTESIGFIPEEIIESLKDARERDVKISVYSNKDIGDWLYDFFEEEEIRFEQLNIHGKHLIIDRSCVVIGSFNWLSFSDNDIDPDDRSIKISGNDDHVRRLRGRIYHALINYGKISDAKMNHEPALGVELDKTPLDLPVNSLSKILLLTMFQQHEDYLKFICRDAKKSIDIYSPFIIYPNAVKRLELIAGEIKENVALHIFLNEYDLIDGTRTGYDSISKFIKHHQKLKGKTIISPLRGSHRKTLIVDDETLSEGSFNWFSSAQSIQSDFHNQDTSLVIQGPIVRDLVQRNRHTLRK